MEKIKNNCLISSTVIDTLLQDVENLFVDFMNTTRHRAMQALRLPDEQITHYFTTWRSGLFLGLALPAIANSIQLVATGKTTIEQPLTILQIYAGLAIPIIFLFLFSANLIIWTKYRVNYTVRGVLLFFSQLPSKPSLVYIRVRSSRSFISISIHRNWGISVYNAGLCTLFSCFWSHTLIASVVICCGKV